MDEEIEEERARATMMEVAPAQRQLRPFNDLPSSASVFAFSISGSYA